MTDNDDFGIENEGSGFAIDDGNSLDELLTVANMGADTDGEEDTAHFFDDNTTYTSDSQVTDTTTTTVMSTSVETVNTTNEPVAHNQTTYDNSEPNMVSEKPHTTSHESPVERKLTMKTETHFINETQRIINVLDTYRGLSQTVRSMVIQFIDVENVDDEAKVVVRALNADPMLGKTMEALRDSASERERVERVFYILRLSNDVLHSLGNLVTALTGKNFTDNADQLTYAKELEESINGLDKQIIEYIVATQNVLKAAQGE